MASAPPEDPCLEAKNGLAQFKNELNKRGPGNVEYAMIKDISLNPSTIFRVLASVTEAISQLSHGLQFSLLNPHAVQSVLSGSSATPLQCARPGNELLIPWTTGDNYGGTHTSLFVVARTDPNAFALKHHDSASNETLHRTSRQQTGNLLRKVLFEAWSQDGHKSIAAGVTVKANRTRQHSDWESGIHAVLHGWAYALGLRLAGNAPQPNGPGYEEFLRQAGEMINLSLQGLMDSETIRCFLECNTFIQAGQNVAFNRKVEKSVRIERDQDYEMLIERINAGRSNAGTTNVTRTLRVSSITSISELEELALID